MLYSERVEEILNYVQDHPINVKSQKMRYVPTSQLDSARLPGYLNFFTILISNMLVKRTPPYFDQIVQIIRRTSPQCGITRNSLPPIFFVKSTL